MAVATREVSGGGGGAVSGGRAVVVGGDTRLVEALAPLRLRRQAEAFLLEPPPQPRDACGGVSKVK